jgi:hypothetical protein
MRAMRGGCPVKFEHHCGPAVIAMRDFIAVPNGLQPMKMLFKTSPEKL